MKKKILFITTRSPYSGRYSGDVIRSLKIINLLKKKYLLDGVCLKENRENINKINVVSFSYPNFLKKMIFCFFNNSAETFPIWFIFFKGNEIIYRKLRK